MFRYIVKRILYSILIMLGVVFIIFAIIELAPGTPASIMLGVRATQEQIDALNAQLGYDRPFLLRYWLYIRGLLHLDLGTSYKYSVPVAKLVGERIVPTLIIAFSAMASISLIGITLGTLSAKKQNSAADRVISTTAGILTALPGFWVALLLLLVFAGKLKLVPTYGVKTWTGYILPVVTVTLTGCGSLIKLTRSAMLDIVHQDFIRTARAYGEREKNIIPRHAVKNAMMPIVTSIGYTFAGMLGGTVLMENIFTINGVGKLIMEAITARDIPCVAGVTVVIAGLFCIVQLLIELSYLLIDARVKSKYGL